jgi:DNA-binding LytR/AlgR family response regulator
MNELYEKLDKNMLYRVHKSFVVNFHYIKSIKENDIELYHYNKTVPISRSYRKMTLEDYTNFVERNLFV